MSERSVCIALLTSLCYTCREELERYFKHADSECTWCQYHMQLVKLRCIAFAPWLPFTVCSFLLSCKLDILFHIALLDSCIQWYAVVYPDCYCARERITCLIYLVYCTTMHNVMISFNVCLVAELRCSLLWCPGPCQSTCLAAVNLQSQLYRYSVRTLDPLHLPTSLLIAT